uniref:Ubiquitin-related modifier 1 n=1 Tax=Kalanchoe fedtschenkoi TaxID=63787 RepID=A0A7N0SZF4_KALFE
MQLTLEFGRPGVLVLVNVCDWELGGQLKTVL